MKAVKGHVSVEGDKPIAAAQQIGNGAMLDQPVDIDSQSASSALSAAPPEVLFDVAAVTGLVYALADWLQAHIDSEAELDASRLALLEQAVAALETMTRGVCAKRMPQPLTDLVKQLVASKDKLGNKVAATRMVRPEMPVVVVAERSVKAERPQVYDEVDEQLLQVFLEEADELCPRISAELRAWRGRQDDDEQPQLLKRLLHTLKGSARMAGAMHIGEIVHKMEERILSAAQKDQALGFLGALESDFNTIHTRLESLRADNINDELASRRRRAADQTVSRMKTNRRAFEEGMQELAGSMTCLHEQLREVKIQAQGRMQARVSLAKDSAGQIDPFEFDRFARLQELVRLMNESVHDVQTAPEAALKNFAETVDAITEQNQARARMVPFASISKRLYRIAQQTAKELNKRANFELFGADMELGHSVLKKMTAPFEHLLRNAMVHGIEDSQARTQSGKNFIGEIRLSVRHENNEVVFELSDDGAGLNLDVLREKALAKDLIYPDEAVSDDRLAQLIFVSGISTATEVTEVAGRGIGLDVVRSEIAALGGRIDVITKKGLGTRFIIHLPLTLDARV